MEKPFIGVVFKYSSVTTISFTLINYLRANFKLRQVLPSVHWWRKISQPSLTSIKGLIAEESVLLLHRSHALAYFLCTFSEHAKTDILHLAPVEKNVKIVSSLKKDLNYSLLRFLFYCWHSPCY